MTETSEPARFTSALPIGTKGEEVKAANCPPPPGPHPIRARPEAPPHNPAPGRGGTQPPPLAVLLLEPLRDPEGSAVRADVLAHQKDPFVAGHFFIERLRDRLEVGDFPSRCRGCGHGCTSSSLANTPFNVSGPSGRGLFSANSTPASTSFVTRSPTSRNAASSA